MSANPQFMIAAPRAPRTRPAALFDTGAGFPAAGHARPRHWTLGDVPFAGPAFASVYERLSDTLRLRPADRAVTLLAGHRYTALVDNETLPFADAAFDVVISGFGAMFAPDHRHMADELLRVCRRGGRIGLANWAPQGFAGQLIATLATYTGATHGSGAAQPDPAAWGRRDYLNGLFGHAADALWAAERLHTLRFLSPAHWLAQWRGPGGPLHAVFAGLHPVDREQLATELLTLVRRFNEVGDGSMRVRSAWLEFVVYKSGWRA